MQLESCLLTSEEMGPDPERADPESWLGLPDPLTPPRPPPDGTDEAHSYEHLHDERHHPEDAVEGDALGGVSEASLRAMMERAMEQGLPMHDFLGDVFEVVFDEHAVAQIRACAPVLREALQVCQSTDNKHRGQQKILEGVVNLVNAPGGRSTRGNEMLKQTPAILMAMYAPHQLSLPPTRTHSPHAPTHCVSITSPHPPPRAQLSRWRARGGRRLRMVRAGHQAREQ